MSNSSKWRLQMLGFFVIAWSLVMAFGTREMAVGVAIGLGVHALGAMLLPHN